MSRRRVTVAAVAVLTVGLGLGLGPAAEPARAAGAPKDTRPTAAVSLGDSYISGEAGRWKGNSADPAAGHDGTDRAYRDGVADPALVYGASAANGCHRSDVAEISGALLPVQRRINLACSGAKTVNVLRASAGGLAFKGEAPQDDQLLEVARANRVTLIALSIGGNDLGFGSILSSCVFAYLFGSPPCSTSQDAAVRAGLPTVGAAVAATLQDVRATMRAAGYRDGSYRLVLQSYPTPLARTAKSRLTGDSGSAKVTAGCPFLAADADWAARLTPSLAAVQQAAATTAGAQFLDLTAAFRGHQLCAAGTTSAREWVRFIDLAGQGDTAESLHPNYYGQRALGRCLTWASLTRSDLACKAVPKLGTWAVYPTPA